MDERKGSDQERYERRYVHFELKGQVAEDGAVVPGGAAGDEGEDSPLCFFEREVLVSFRGTGEESLW
jgi:hypothetical protein